MPTICALMPGSCASGVSRFGLPQKTVIYSAEKRFLATTKAPA
jgi:hypothetical protein